LHKGQALLDYMYDNESPTDGARKKDRPQANCNLVSLKTMENMRELRGYSLDGHSVNSRYEALEKFFSLPTGPGELFNILTIGIFRMN
jgi:hypothetical protein